MDAKLQDKINRLTMAKQHLLSSRERRLLIRLGFAEWVAKPTPDSPRRKLLLRTYRCPEPTF